MKTNESEATDTAAQLAADMELFLRVIEAAIERGGRGIGQGTNSEVVTWLKNRGGRCSTNRYESPSVVLTASTGPFSYMTPTGKPPGGSVLFKTNSHLFSGNFESALK
jgi:hypothetical protein